MIFHIDPLEKDDIDTIIDIYWRACQNPEADHPLPLILTSGLQQDARALLREEFEPSDSRWEKRYTVAREVETGEIAAVCGWTMNHKALRKGLDVFDCWEDEVLPVRRELHDEFPVRAINVAMDEAFTKAVVLAELGEVAGERRYATLDLLATDPKWQQQGAASALLREFLDRVEGAGLNCYVVASTMGRRLYMNFGFEPRKSIQFDAREWYDGNRRCVHWLMMRQSCAGGRTMKNKRRSPSSLPQRRDKANCRLRSRSLHGA